MQEYNDSNQNDRKQGVRRPVSSGKRQAAPRQAQGATRRRSASAPKDPGRQNAQGAPQGMGKQQRMPSSMAKPSAPKRAGQKPPKKNNPKKKALKIALFILEIFVICILVGVCWAMSKAKEIQHVQITDEEKKEELAINEAIAESEVLDGYRNIALFGVDSRDGQLGKGTRTDTIMIASINLKTKEVRLVSVYRDTWLNLSTDSYNKANAAYAKGGYKQAIAMLNMNLDLDIEDFATVGFNALIDVIDAVGGIEIDIKQDEISHLNNYQISMVGHPIDYPGAVEQAYDATPYVEYMPVEHAGVQTLNGLQATAYARVRYVGSDLERAARQRTVLTKVAKKAMTLNPATLNKIADAVFPNVMTSLSMTEILELLKDIASYEIGETTGFPFDGYIVPNGRVGSASVVVPVDLDKNVSLLHEFLFDEAGYSPSDTVKKCSKKIASDTGISYNGE